MKSRAHRYRYVRHVAMSCFPDGRASVAPPTLSYASPQSWTYGVAITTLSPTTTGATSFAVNSGTLPTGVSLNTTTGDITGTPTVAKVAANVVIRATGPGGTADATINIEVPSPLYTSLVDYWNLDEASGTRVGSHAALDLTDNNTVTSGLGVDGVSTAADFERDNSESLSRASEAALQPSAVNGFTICGWVNQETVNGYAAMIAKDDAAANRQFYLAPAATGGKPEMNINGDSAIAQWGSTLSTGTWYFLVGQWKASDSKAYINVNNGTAVASAGTATVSTTGTDALRIGSTSSATYFYDGLIQSVGYWNRVLTASELTWLYNSGSAARAYSALATYDGG